MRRLGGHCTGRNLETGVKPNPTDRTSAAVNCGNDNEAIDQLSALHMGIFKLKFSMNFLMNLTVPCRERGRGFFMRHLAPIYPAQWRLSPWPAASSSSRLRL